MSFSRAKWVAFDSCLVLNNLSWTKWKSVFNGAHIVLGFDSVGLIDEDLGPQFVERMKGGVYGGNDYPVTRIREAWEFTLIDTTIDHSLKGAYMWAEPCKEDYLPGYGPFCPAPIKENENYITDWTTFDLI